MQTNLVGKKILIVTGSLLARHELERALREKGAKVVTVTNLVSAFAVVDRNRFDAAVIDRVLHNQAFELCDELRALGVRYLMSDVPNDLQSEPRREAAAKSVAATLEAKLSANELQQAPTGNAGYDFGEAVPRFPAVRGEASMVAFRLES